MPGTYPLEGPTRAVQRVVAELVDFGNQRMGLTPALTPELNATQKWWAAFMGDRAFARDRAAGKSETEAGHARAKAGADIALCLPAEYRD